MTRNYREKNVLMEIKACVRVRYIEKPAIWSFKADFNLVSYYFETL